MKPLKYIFLILFVVAISSCDEYSKVRFLEPQPINKKDSKSFPKKYRGEYLSKTNSSRLIINTKTIYKENRGWFRASNLELEEEFDTIYKTDITINAPDNIQLTFEIEAGDDSATVHAYAVDTLFDLSDVNLLREYKGKLFLNYKQNDLSWKVKIVSLDKGQLDLNYLISMNQIDTINEITNVKTVMDTSSNNLSHYELNPRRKELKEILKRRETESRYIKIK